MVATKLQALGQELVPSVDIWGFKMCILKGLGVMGTKALVRKAVGRKAVERDLSAGSKNVGSLLQRKARGMTVLSLMQLLMFEEVIWQDDHFEMNVCRNYTLNNICKYCQNTTLICLKKLDFFKNCNFDINKETLINETSV